MKRKKRPTPTKLAALPGTVPLWIWGVLLVALVAAVYWPTLNNGFIWDDDRYIEGNANLQSPAGLADIWFKLGAVPQYYPLVHSTFWVEYHLWGLAPRGYHIDNLLLHAASAVLIWRLLWRLSVPGAWLAAAIFAVHPVHVESVAWVTERKNVLSCALALASLLAYLRFAPPEPGAADTPPGNRWRYYAISLGLFVAALLSKTVVVSLPAVLLVIFFWKRERLTLGDVTPLVPFFAVGLALASVTVWMEKTTVGAHGQEWDFSPIDRLLIAGRVLWFYAGKLVWPHPIIFFYPRWSIDAHVWWQHLFPCAALLVLVALWLARRRIGRGPLAAVLIFAGVLTPALGFFDVYPFRFSFVADHFQYHASIAMIALAAAAAVGMMERGARDRGVARFLAAGLLVGLAVISQQRTYVYQNQKTLFSETIAQNPAAWAAHHNLGNILLIEGKRDEALRHYRTSLEIHPGDARVQNSLGAALLQAGQLDEAETQFASALGGEWADSEAAEIHYGLSQVFERQKKYEQAFDHYRQSLALRPNDFKTLYRYAMALGLSGNLPRGIEIMGLAILSDPQSADARYQLGVMLSLSGKMPEAVPAFQKAVSLEPANAIYQEGLGLALLKNGDPAAAETCLRRAIQIAPQNSQAHNRLGVALLEQGQTAAAIVEFQAALVYDPQNSDATANLRSALETGADKPAK